MFFFQGCSFSPDEDEIPEKPSPKISPTASGAKIGDFLQKAIMNPIDELVVAKSIQKTLENGASGYPTKWRNRVTGNDGDIIPFPIFKDKHQRYCRKFFLTYANKGKSNPYSGKACRQDNGQWQVTEASIGRKI